MKVIGVFLTAMIWIGTSLASTQTMPASGNAPYGKVTTTASSARTVTPKGPALVRSIKIQKPKLFTGNPHKVALFAEDSDNEVIEVDDIITSYRRRDLQRVEHPNTDNDPDQLSEDIRWRLFLARQLALLKYREIHG